VIRFLSGCLRLKWIEHNRRRQALLFQAQADIAYRRLILLWRCVEAANWKFFDCDTIAFGERPKRPNSGENCASDAPDASFGILVGEGEFIFAATALAKIGRFGRSWGRTC
jgi:hypothetical protein